MSLEVEISQIEVELAGAQTPCTHNIQNSDGSYSEDIDGDFVLPDITFTDSDGSQSQVPSVKDIVATPGATLPDRGYCYPVLSQTTEYREGDEGWQIANIWNAIYGGAATNSLAQEIGADFYTLKHNNIHGNTARFTNTIGTDIQNTPLNTTGAIFQDHLTGLQFVRLDNTTGFRTWEQYIDDSQNEQPDYYPIPVVIWHLLRDVGHTGEAVNKFMGTSITWTASTDFDATTFATNVRFDTNGYRQFRTSKTTALCVNTWAYKLIE